MLKNEPFMSNRWFKKGAFSRKIRFYPFIKLFFAHFFLKTGFLLLDHLFWIADNS